jgi:lipid II:glycine glycyltransferase (peptidoglycan interpeptide bridge formation enzyme)
MHVVGPDSGALVLFRTFPGGLKLAYVPKGPLGILTPDFIKEIAEICRSQRAFTLKIEPDALESAELSAKLLSLGFQPSSHIIQPRRTLVVNLREDEERILASMHQKTRYNIRLAKRKGVQVRSTDDVDSFNEMLRVTSERDQFGVHTLQYYQAAYDLFAPDGHCILLVAEHEGEALAAIMVFAYGSRAWYFYGASNNQKRNLMPTYLLQWEAMRWAQNKGCTTYDLWGVPDFEFEQLENDFTQRSDGLWGVYRFKRGFGGKLFRTIGTWDLPLNPLPHTLYRLFTLAFTRR